MGFGNNNNNEEKRENNGGGLVQIGALWESGSDKVIASGYLGNARLLVLKNNYKKEDKHPDYVLCVARNEPKRSDSNTDVEPGVI